MMGFVFIHAFLATAAGNQFVGISIPVQYGLCILVVLPRNTISFVDDVYLVGMDGCFTKEAAKPAKETASPEAETQLKIDIENKGE